MMMMTMMKNKIAHSWQKNKTKKKKVEELLTNFTLL